MTLDEFRKTRKENGFSLEGDIRYVYANFWRLNCNLDDKYSTGVEDFDTLEEAEVALYQMYCDEDRLTEGY